MILGPEQARILVVSASPYTRFVISGELSTASDLFVVGTLERAEEITYKEALLKPDLAIVDIQSQGDLAGLEQVVKIGTPVLAVCAASQDGAEVALAALELGAADVVAWPNGSTDLPGLAPSFTSQVRRLARLKPRPVFWRWPSVVIPHRAENRQFLPGDSLVVVSASTGELCSLIELLTKLPVDLPASVLVFLPLPTPYLGVLLRRIDGVTPFQVRQLSHKLSLQKGKVYLAVDGCHIDVEAPAHLTMDCDPFSRDVEAGTNATLFTLAAHYGSALVYVMLAGTEQNGAQGACSVQAAGGLVLVQEASACVSGEVSSSIPAPGSNTPILPTEQLAEKIVSRVRDHQARQSCH